MRSTQSRLQAKVSRTCSRGTQSSLQAKVSRTYSRSTQSRLQAKVSRTYSRSAQSSFQAKVSPTRHTRRTRPTPQENSSAKPCASPPGGATRTLPLPMRNKRTLFSDALLPALYLKRAQPEIYGIMQDCFRWIVPFCRVRPINHRNFIGAIC